VPVRSTPAAMTAAASARYMEPEFTLMSHSHSRRLRDRHEPTNANGHEHFAHSVESPHHTTDSAIDAALRSVPLPKGLLTRLGSLVYAMPEDAPDQVDWLGC
jgi:hypothetical protein